MGGVVGGAESEDVVTAAAGTVLFNLPVGFGQAIRSTSP
jgi:hypothetical protein